MDPGPAALPQISTDGILIGLGVLAGSWALSRVVRFVGQRVLAWRGRSPSAARMFSSLAGSLVLLLGLAAAVTVIFPSVKPVNALGGIGVLSIAAGIAFQTVLSNMFAGIVILARDVFRVGDQIAVDTTAGTVTEINLTSTVVQSFDGRLVMIPNAVVHSQIVTVQTGYEHVRSTLSVDVDDSSDLDLAVRVAEEAMLSAVEVFAEPPPQALLHEVGTATVRMELRFWSGARQMETRLAQHEVIRAVLLAFAEVGVRTGSDVVVVEGGPLLLEALSDPAEETP